MTIMYSNSHWLFCICRRHLVDSWERCEVHIRSAENMSGLLWNWMRGATVEYSLWHGNTTGMLHMTPCLALQTALLPGQAGDAALACE